MSISWHKTKKRWNFEFKRSINGVRVRSTRMLPASWTQAQADTYDRQESARLYAQYTGVERVHATVSAAIALYAKERLPELKHGANVLQELALMYPYYAERPLTDLADIAREYLAGNGHLSAATLRIRLRYLSAAARYAWKAHGVCESDPAARMRFPTVRNERTTFIGRDVLVPLARACGAPSRQNSMCRQARAFMLITFYSGLRRSEIYSAVIKDGCFTLADTKNGTSRSVPIHPKLSQAIRYLPSSMSVSTLEKWFQLARSQINRDDLHFHDLRHSAASEMLAAGVPLHTIGTVLGHKDSRSTQRYAHLQDSALRFAVGQIGQKRPDQLVKPVLRGDHPKAA